ncbi:hypothetical protein [Sporolactobacillus laevolacticus]|uniref:Uncharacterized protein n=1 Tax=Sporolactobacillus laevolacticus DSM 442 TaxID=1395513 RepID=V6J2G2_9BACL|nr:hypothetical protein [Sporolactobacillus laevolacticus]EST10949.1 hypothetical protein P343_15175 [Sporolactobacillus laevolacticus DSM 442]MDN3955805.1 hypothetical protein [Sporolactobacillus laevolacticus]
MNQTQTEVVQTEKNNFIASIISFIGTLLFVISSTITLIESYKSYVLATENISV